MDQPRDKLKYSLERGSTILRELGANANQSFIQPNFRKFLVALEEKPLRTTFITSFVALSLLPIVSFIGFSLFTFGLFTFVALCIATFASIVTICFFGIFFIAILALMFLISISLTAAITSAYLAFRLVTLMRLEGASGVREWSTETKGRIYGKGKAKSKEEPTDDPKPEVHDEEDETESVLSDGHSSGSTVVVDSALSPRSELHDLEKDTSDPVIIKHELEEY